VESPDIPGRFTFCFVAFDQLLDPVAGDAVVAGDLAFAAAFDDDGGDDELGFGHR
jgi:hypothetical protein